MSEHLVSPVMRLVSGSLTEKQKTDYQNKPIAEDDQRYSYGLALRKDDPGAQGLLQGVMQKAWNDYGQAPRIQNIIQQFNLGKNSGFSWKIKDGDVPNNEGRTNPNTQGCWVFYFSSSYLTKTYDQTNKELDAAQFYTGCFVQIAFNVVGNGKTDNTAGIYLNPQVLRFIAHGEKIVGGMDAKTAFAGVEVPQQLPPGASLTPVATGGMPGVPPVGQSPGTGQSNMAPGLPTAQPTAQPNTNLTTGYPTNNQQMPTVATQQMAPAQTMPGMPAQQPQAAPLQGFSNGQVQQQAAPLQPGMPQMPGMPGTV